jgi:WD40 repeat protein
VPEVDPDRGWVATYGTNGVVTVFDLEDGSELMRLAGHTGAINDVTFDHTRDRLYSAALDGETRVWDITPAGPIGSGVFPIDSGQDISSSPGPVALVVSPDGSEVAVSTGGGKISRYQTDDGSNLGSVTGAVNWFLPAPVSPDWRLLAIVEDVVAGIGDPLPEASVQSLIGGKQVLPLPPCTWPKGFSSDGSMVLLDGQEVMDIIPQCASDNVPAEVDGRTRVVDLASGDVVLDLGDRPAVSTGAFNPPGVFDADRYLAINVGFELSEIHDVVTGELVSSVSVEGDFPLSVAFDPSGQYLAVGGQNSHAWVVDVEALIGGASVEEAMVMFEEVGSGGVAHVALGPGGVLATSGHDPNVRLWDIHSGDVLHELGKTPDVSRPVAFTSEGDLLYIDGNMEQGHVVRRFPLDADRLIELAESRVTRGLTEKECERYLPLSGLVTCP